MSSKRFLPLVALAAILLAGCVADHHHHPPAERMTDEAFDEYFRERTDGEGIGPGPGMHGEPGPHQ